MNSLYQQAKFLTSAPRLEIAPPDIGFEVAFAGRSNAGKSSAINAITSRKSLARTSKAPGRTQQLVFFQLDEERRLVDLPGYGYAKVPAHLKEKWQAVMEDYLAYRESLRGVFLLVDSRHPLTDFDLQMIEYCEYARTRLHLVLTKADKLTRGPANSALLKVQKQLEALRVTWSVQLFSAVKRNGIEEAHGVLDDWLQVGE